MKASLIFSSISTETMKNYRHLIEQFENQSLPQTGWTHEAHLVVGLWYTSSYSLEEAICKIKSGIFGLNQFHQTANTANAGYHETLTVFYAKILFEAQLKFSHGPFEVIVEKILNSPLASRSLALEFYEKNQLMSPPLRAIYHPETKQTIDAQCIEKYLSLH
jgi:hypothetical protein